MQEVDDYYQQVLGDDTGRLFSAEMWEIILVNNLMKVVCLKTQTTKEQTKVVGSCLGAIKKGINQHQTQTRVELSLTEQCESTTETNTRTNETQPHRAMHASFLLRQPATDELVMPQLKLSIVSEPFFLIELASDLLPESLLIVGLLGGILDCQLEQASGFTFSEPSSFLLRLPNSVRASISMSTNLQAVAKQRTPETTREPSSPRCVTVCWFALSLSVFFNTRT